MGGLDTSVQKYGKNPQYKLVVEDPDKKGKEMH